MSEELSLVEFESLSDVGASFIKIGSEVPFSKEMQDLQSSLNKKRLLELQKKISRFPHKQFNIYIGEFYFDQEAEETVQNEILFVVFVYAKGLMCDWEHPLFTFYVMHADESFSLDRLLRLILQLLHAVKLQPFACILNWSPWLQQLLCDAGITVYNPYIGEDHRRTLLCTDFFKSIKKFELDKCIPEDIMAYIEYFDKECENLENWKTEFQKFKELLENSFSIGVQIFSLYYTVSSRITALELAKIVGIWPLKMVTFRQTKLDLFLYRIKLEKFSNYEEILRALPNIYQEYY